MFRRALRLGARVSVASCAAVVPATAAACLSDSKNTARRNQCIWGGYRASMCLAANESTYKFKPSVALKRHQSLNDLDVQDDDVALADASEQVPAKEADPAENAVAVAVN